MGGTVTLKEQWHLARKYGSFEKSITAIFRTDAFTSRRCDGFSRAFFWFMQYIKESVCCNSCQSCICSCYGWGFGPVPPSFWTVAPQAAHTGMLHNCSFQCKLQFKMERTKQVSAAQCAVKQYLLTGTSQPLFSLTSKVSREPPSSLSLARRLC